MVGVGTGRSNVSKPCITPWLLLRVVRICGVSGAILCPAAGQPLAEPQNGNTGAEKGRWQMPNVSPQPASLGTAQAATMGPLCKRFSKESHGFRVKYF